MGRHAKAVNAKDLRAHMPRAGLGDFASDGRDPVRIIREQNATRLQQLVPVRTARMLQSPFAFFRGSAGLMAHDLASSPSTGIRVLSCGDAHISNFGLFASPERRQLFDLNDFDEVGFAPWEWDVKRLAASIMVSARENGHTEEQGEQAAVDAAATYRSWLNDLMLRSPLERHFMSIDIDAILALADSKSLAKLVERTAKKARKRTSARMVEKITTTDASGELRIAPDPPLLVPAHETLVERFADVHASYRDSLPPSAAALMAQFHILDVALRVVGVGSVGTRCFIVLLGTEAGDTLILQVKEATKSVLETYGGQGPSAFLPRTPESGREAYRVVAGQQILQAQSDPFLGWTPTVAGHDFYWRQFRDMKGSVATEELTCEQFHQYCRMCAVLLARAHAQSPAAEHAAAYMGKSTDFDEAIGRFAVAYADQNERDYAALQAAVATGALPCADEA